MSEASQGAPEIQFHMLCIYSHKVWTSPVTKCWHFTWKIGKCIGENITRGGGTPLWRKTCVSLYKKNVRNRSVWEPDHFEFSDKKPFEPHKNCPGQSRFRVLSFSSLILWWRVSGNILRICPCNLTVSKKMTWYCKYCGDAWQIAGSSTQASRICGCVSIFKYLHACVCVYIYMYIYMHAFVCFYTELF